MFYQTYNFFTKKDYTQEFLTLFELNKGNQML